MCAHICQEEGRGSWGRVRACVSECVRLSVRACVLACACEGVSGETHMRLIKRAEGGVCNTGCGQDVCVGGEGVVRARVRVIFNIVC